MAARPEHLYVHVPLCRSKCAYCDFYSIGAISLETTPEHLALLLGDQALSWLDRNLEPRPLQTLYIGGGTPSMLGMALPELVGRIADAFGLDPAAEVTVEANPDSLDPMLLHALARAGVTRLSLGVQSFDDAELVLLGRAHDADRARRAIDSALAAGLSLSLDLMCGLPGQTEESWRRTLDTAAACGAGHVSVYPLSLEAGTPLAAAVLIGDLAEPDPDVAADAMLAAARTLSAAGFQRYEVASYAKPGRESRHNTAYWTGAEYLGVGPAAHGMLSASVARAAGFVALPPQAARIRYSVAADMTEGLSRTPRVDFETLDAAETVREDAMLGMRLVAGIADGLAQRADVVDVLESLEAEGLVRRADGRWATTERGWLLGNQVFGRIWNAGAV